ncbi:GH36-type glycosyl hydrolase domain-containing protein [Luteibacter sp. 9135]|uniref:GH36-type glycosyl hydrolase domain-containing protein n=1 Tax=Luteibacter sp. 9135 TaxID=1500893 RepID=UPI000B2354E2|nr:glucoamylase family protein [Luteibacter sp. 9135]
MLPRLADNETVIVDACRGLMAAGKRGEGTTPAGEWLLDNLYVMEEHVRAAEKDFPKGYSRELPQLDGGPSSGLPRVYDIALEVISHGDGRIDAAGLARFLDAYQTVVPLSLGELWAVPIMLRLALIENLRRIAVRVTLDRSRRRRATRWADAMTRMAAEDPKNVVLVVADMARSAPVMSAPFVAEMVRRLQGQGPALAMPLGWVEQRLAESGRSTDHLVQAESQQQAMQQVSVGNSIGSLRSLATIDWRDFVEAASLVESCLREDPSSVYPAMDFASRDRYRHAVEKLSRITRIDERTVARRAIAAAQAPDATSAHSAARHVGYHLVGAGRPALERALGARRRLATRCRQAFDRAPFAWSLVAFLTLTGALTTALVGTAALGPAYVWERSVLALGCIVVASQLGLSLLNLIASLLTAPDYLPRMDYEDGLPDAARTLVAVPTMLGSPQDADDVAEGLEVRFLANRDDALHFALLTDFPDADQAVMPGDEAILAQAAARIHALNATYPSSAADRFYLLHRPREWSPTQGRWIGFDRKRGKLAALNALLRGEGADRFLLIVGRIAQLPAVRYVITLDTDTHLPRDTAHRLVAAMDHPLNRPVFADESNRVIAGYSLMQPRVGIALPAQARSAYARLYGADAGVDPYTRAVSDVYQDLFHEGSFTGKGIYDVDAFERAMAGRLKDERVLSHDLIEGCFVRSALLSDVLVFEEIPERYADDSVRRHRWMRGDWQLLPWLLPTVPSPHGWVANDLSALSRWKLFDNLRRSLVAPAALALLVAGWLWIAPALTWTVAILAMMVVPVLLQVLMDAARKPHDIAWRQHAGVQSRAAAEHALRLGLSIAWLPHDARLSVDAIARSLWRVCVSRKHLLEWRSSADVERQGRGSRQIPWGALWAGPATAIVVAALLAVARPLVLPVALPWLLAWLASPPLAWWISRAQVSKPFAPSEADHAFLRLLARRTWAFFETHMGPDDHWLPPDNVQMAPSPQLARRTSPTNMGLGLLAGLAAYDFGYLGAGALVQRLANTLATMQGLERHRGHFYNWYDTATLAPMRPLYVSSVDSGNLAGHLLTLQRGLLDVAQAPVFRNASITGLRDTVALLAQTTDENRRAPLTAWAGDLAAAMLAPPACMRDVLAFVTVQQERLREVTPQASDHVSSGDDEGAFWLSRLTLLCDELHEEASLWYDAATDGQAIPTLMERAANTTDAAQAERATARLRAMEAAASLAGDLAIMDHAFLYDAHRRLLSIGFDVERRTLDASFYDLLASEARLTTFVAIAQGQLPQESWFSLGRLLTSTGGSPVLLSWTGSMFEYLMPMLVMPTYEGSLLEQTCRAAVARQIEYGRQRNLPWGVSESGYHAVDAQMTYQYRAFGVPGLGLKRGLGEDLVVAPYASVLALMVAPAAATDNLRRLARAGLAGRFGLYEAVDYTPSRLPPGQESAVVRQYMAHHQGMSLLAIGHVLLDRPMQKRFESDPRMMATSLLLQERVPRMASEYLHTAGLGEVATAPALPEARLRLFTDPDRPRPAVQLLSNGRYHVMVSSAGGGYSRRDGMAVTRWREDITRDSDGMFCYIRDPESGDVWSTAYQPVARNTDRFEAIFAESRAEFRVRQRGFETHTEIVVSPEDDIELRRTRITNRGNVRRTVELTSYAEVVLADPRGDAAHPAFSKLFVTTEIVPDMQALLCTRRPRSADETPPSMCHMVAVHDADVDAISYETDRARFIGRGRSTASPVVMDAGHDALSGGHGAVLDPIVAIRVRITLDPEQTATLDFVTGVADTRPGCLRLIEKYRDRYLADRTFDLAWTRSQVLLRQANATLVDAQLYEHMATSILYPNLALRAEPELIAANRRGQSGLWGQAVSGDLPIVLLRIGDIARLDIARELVRAAAYWRQRGLTVDLVIWNEDSTGYRQTLHDALTGLLATGAETNLLDRPGGVFIRAAQSLSHEDRLVMEASACIVVVDTLGSLHEQMERHRIGVRAAAAEPAWPARRRPAPAPAVPVAAAFSADGTEYVITLAPGATTPAPWCNVLANPSFGSVVSESGSAYTWAENAHGCRLTPWQNDPVEDACGEAIYLRDEATGHTWCPTPLPMRGEGTYVTRHGFGYSVFEHTEGTLSSRLEVFVALDASVKFQVLRLTNDGAEPRRLSITAYVEWLLGDVREKSAMHVVTEIDPSTGALFARNAYNSEFPDRVAFLDVEDAERDVGGDRTGFLGRNGHAGAPLGMRRAGWHNRVGAGLDPCGVLRSTIALAPGESRDVVIRLGMGVDEVGARGLVLRFRDDGSAARALAAVREHWRQTLGAVQVSTPDEATDRFANGWLLYQTIAARLWARSGYYQSGGAIGFRDQLQDSMATQHAAPAMARAQLLVCAAHQFAEGDVMHWWHPPGDRGVRTTCSDDYLWLPLATSRYVQASADTGVLDESIEFIEGRTLRHGEESWYDQARPSGQRATLYAHCVRAIEHAMPRGRHGLPLMGGGDWNDGMNKVGEGGQGESVWLGFFLVHVLREFAVTARGHGDAPFAERCLAEADTLSRALEAEAWDGDWYRRAWFDDGTPLGSAANDECRIDAIAQSWSVLSGVAGTERREQAMASLDEHLVLEDPGMIRLLDPPFDRSAMDPGYIKGYVPGVRENGGQYTHAAVWAAMAFAQMGRHERAWELVKMIHPASHTGDAQAIERYKVEPYVIAADVYSVPPHVGRGGWSWYTGSAGWMYRLLVETLLGLRREGDLLRIVPRVPAAWPGYGMRYRHGGSGYVIALRPASDGEAGSVHVDGVLVSGGAIPLVDDGTEHRVEVVYLRH